MFLLSPPSLVWISIAIPRHTNTTAYLFFSLFSSMLSASLSQVNYAEENFYMLSGAMGLFMGGTVCLFVYMNGIYGEVPEVTFYGEPQCVPRPAPT